MSASTGVARRATAIHPLFINGQALSRSRFRVSSLAAGSASYRRQLPTHLQAVALLIPNRHIATEPHRQGSSLGPPPPGFNAAEAQKPPTETTPSPRRETKAKPETERQAKEDRDTTKLSSTVQKDQDGLPPTTTASGKEEESAGKELEKKDKKLTLGQRIKKEAQHYWDGTKLLAAEVKISTRLALKMAAGYELSRREHKQLQRTVQDLGRLVPFSVFIIVPLGELLLPFALRLFPGLLPSTFEGQKSRDAKATILRNTRNDVSTFLRATLKETGLPVTSATAQKEEFGRFFRKLRSTGETPTDEDVIKVCNIFKDDLTLDNLSRPQLVSMCRYMNLSTFGTDMMLRYQIRHRMRQIKRDDKAIAFEGVDTLTVEELRNACASRGIKTYGVSPAQMRTDLQTWLDLRLKEKIPSTLLVLSNAYMYSGNVTSQIEALVGVLSSIPEELFHEIELEVHNAEGAATNKQRLEVLKEQQDLIEEENLQNEENNSTGFATPRDVDDIDEKEEARLQTESADASPVQAQVAEAVDAVQETATPVEKKTPGTKTNKN